MFRGSLYLKKAASIWPLKVTCHAGVFFLSPMTFPKEASATTEKDAVMNHGGVMSSYEGRQSRTARRGLRDAFQPLPRGQLLS
jgi:hypothetical protein